MPAEPKKERHHYVPRFYLRYFVDPDNEPFLWMYDKEGRDPRAISVTDAALETHFYSFTTPEGDRDSTTVEDALAGAEDQVAPLWPKLIDRHPLTNQDRSVISFFLSLMMTRVPAFRQNIQRFLGEVVKMTTVMAANRGALPAPPPAGKKALDALQRGDFDVSIKGEASLAAITGDLAPVFHRMTWAFVRARRRYRFLTCDNPLFYLDPTHDPRSFYGVGLLNDNVEVTFPISPELALVAGWKLPEDMYISGTEKLVKSINLRTIMAALRFVYGSQQSEGLKKLVQRYRGSAPRIEVR